MTRREIVAAVAAVPFGAGFTPSASSRAPAGEPFEPWLEVHAGHLRRNVQAIATFMDGRPVCPVLKNNAYGLGLLEVARILGPDPAVIGVAVVKPDEAFRLREAGFRKPVLLMARVPDDGWEELAVRRITPCLNAATPVAAALERIAARRKLAVEVQVDVDTGLGRVGVPHREAAGFIRDIAGRNGLRLTGVMTSLTEDVEYDREQVRRFETLLAELDRDRIATGKRHLVTSITLFQHPTLRFDLARTGIAVYGVHPSASYRTRGLLELVPAIALRARVVNVSHLDVGDSVGYDRVYTATEPVWVATVPVGHADGWPRATLQGATVRIGDTGYPVVSLSASHCVVVIGSDPVVRVGDVATCFDWRPGSRPEDVAEACGASTYDLLMHLNPLLPRRTVA